MKKNIENNKYETYEQDSSEDHQKESSSNMDDAMSYDALILKVKEIIVSSPIKQ